MPSLLVTGGAGFIGSNFVRHILASRKGVRVINLDALSYAGNRDSLSDLEGRSDYEFVQGDIGDIARVGELLREHRIDAVVNFAAETHVDRSIDSPEPFIQTNVVGTLRLLEAARAYRRDVPGFRFLHVSTDEVYGTLGADDPAFRETTPFQPNSPYAASKASSDHLVRSYHETYGLPVVTTNCSNNYGPYQFPEKLIPLMILNALEGKSLPIYGDGGNVRDWLYVADHCEAIERVLIAGTPGETYNIGGRCEKTNVQVVDALCAILDELRPRKEDANYSDLKAFVKDRPGHDRRYAIDCGKIERELGWTPSETFETGLRKTVQWYLKNEDWCRAISEKKYQRQRLGDG